MDYLLPYIYTALGELEKSLQPAFIITAMLEDGEGFETVFGEQPDLAYSQHQVTDIQKHRRKLENELFFDKLLKALGIEDRKILFILSILTIYDELTSDSNGRLPLPLQRLSPYFAPHHRDLSRPCAHSILFDLLHPQRPPEERD